MLEGGEFFDEESQYTYEVETWDNTLKADGKKYEKSLHSTEEKSAKVSSTQKSLKAV